MSKYTQFDWATDRLARTSWADEEERMIRRMDRKVKRTKSNKKNHRNYA